MPCLLSWGSPPMNSRTLNGIVINSGTDEHLWLRRAIAAAVSALGWRCGTMRRSSDLVCDRRYNVRTQAEGKQDD